eukprot:2818086-Prymnesium_polylepis.1
MAHSNIASFSAHGLAGARSGPRSLSVHERSLVSRNPPSIPFLHLVPPACPHYSYGGKSPTAAREGSETAEATPRAQRLKASRRRERPSHAHLRAPPLSLRGECVGAKHTRMKSRQPHYAPRVIGHLRVIGQHR